MPSEKGKQAPGALSNNFSLAEMLDPIWAGCVAASDDDWKKWLKKRQIPNFAWSSQARGFFTDRAGRDKRDNEELVRVWYSRRISSAATARSSSPKSSAGSRSTSRSPMCLSQPFPSVPLIGPRALAELEDQLEALDIALTPDDTRWLDDGGRA